MPRRAMIVCNPASGSRNAQADLVEARQELMRRGWLIDLEATRAAGDAGRLVRAAADADLDAVMIAGGDGTLNEAANALVGAGGQRTALGVLPCGTANVWARQLRMPVSYRAVPEAARLMADASVRAIDVGQVTVNIGTAHETMRRFLLWSGLGLDAFVTRSVEPRPPSFRRWGVVGYGLAALRAATRFRGVRATIDLDDRRLRARIMLIVVCNAELYASYFHLAPGARLDDGWLDVSVFHGHTLLQALGHLARLVLRRNADDPRSATYRARRLRVTTRARCDVHVDAEPIGAVPAEYVVVPGALRVLVPDTAPPELFTHGPIEGRR